MNIPLRAVTTALFFLFCLPSFVSGQVLKTWMDTISYAAGVSIAVSFQRHGAGNVDLELMTKAIRDVMGSKEGNTLIDKGLSEKIFNQYITDVKTKPGRDFLMENSKKPGVIVLPSGLQYTIVSTSGSKTKPVMSDTVSTHYTGRFIDGTVFDTSLDTGEPVKFPLEKVIRGWMEGLQLMSVGDKYIFYIPFELAYGERGVQGKIAPYSTLIFEVELLEIEGKQ